MPSEAQRSSDEDVDKRPFTEVVKHGSRSNHYHSLRPNPPKVLKYSGVKSPVQQLKTTGLKSPGSTIGLNQASDSTFIQHDTTNRSHDFDPNDNDKTVPPFTQASASSTPSSSSYDEHAGSSKEFPNDDSKFKPQFHEDHELLSTIIHSSNASLVELLSNKMDQQNDKLLASNDKLLASLQSMTTTFADLLSKSSNRSHGHNATNIGQDPLPVKSTTPTGTHENNHSQPYDTAQPSGFARKLHEKDPARFQQMRTNLRAAREEMLTTSINDNHYDASPSHDSNFDSVEHNDTDTSIDPSNTYVHNNNNKNKTLHIEEQHSLGDKTTMFITDSNSKCRSLPPNMETAQATLSIDNSIANNTSEDSSITHWENTFLDYDDRSPSPNIEDAIPTMSCGDPTTGLISPDDNSPLPTIDRVTPESEITKNVQFDPSITNHCSKGQSLPPTIDGAQTSVSNADSTTNIGSPGSITHLATTCLDSDDRSLPLDIQSTTHKMSTVIADSTTKFIDASDRSPTPDSPKTETTPASTNNTIVDPSQMPPPGTNDLRQCPYPILTSIQDNPTSKSNIVIEHNEIFENAVTLHCHPDEPPGHPNHKHLHMDYHAISFDKIIVKLLESLPVTIMVKLLASLPVTIFFSLIILLFLSKLVQFLKRGGSCHIPCSLGSSARDDARRSVAQPLGNALGANSIHLRASFAFH